MSGGRLGVPGQNALPEPEPPADQQLRFRCTTGRPNISLSSFHIKVGTKCRGVGPGGTDGGGGWCEQTQGLEKWEVKGGRRVEAGGCKKSSELRGC